MYNILYDMRECNNGHVYNTCKRILLQIDHLYPFNAIIVQSITLRKSSIHKAVYETDNGDNKSFTFIVWGMI